MNDVFRAVILFRVEGIFERFVIEEGRRVSSR